MGRHSDAMDKDENLRKTCRVDAEEKVVYGEEEEQVYVYLLVATK